MVLMSVILVFLLCVCYSVLCCCLAGVINDDGDDDDNYSVTRPVIHGHVVQAAVKVP